VWGSVGLDPSGVGKFDVMRLGGKDSELHWESSVK